jgi:hypothetical protein
MGNLKTALIDLNAVSNLEHISLEEQGTLLENSMQEFKDIAAIGEPCINSCSTNFDTSPTYALPTIPIPNGTIAFGTPTVGYTALVQPFTYTGTDADSFTAKVNGVSIGTVTSPIDLTGLTMGTLYLIEVTPVNTYGTGTPASTSLTTLNWALNQLPAGSGGSTGFISFGLADVTAHTITQPFTYSASDAIGFLFKLDNSSPVPITSPIELDSLVEATVYNLKVAAVTNFGIGQYASKNIQTLTLPDTPQGVIIFGVPELTHNSIIQPFTYTESDADFFLVSVTQEVTTPLGALSSPITLNDLLSDTVYTISVTPVNSLGSGNTFSTSPKTLVAPIVTAISKFTLEAYRINSPDDQFLLKPGYRNEPLSIPNFIDNFGKYIVTFNDSPVGVINLNNAGGSSHPYNDEYNFPPEQALMALSWAGSPYARMSTIQVNEEVAQAIANSAYVPNVGYEDYIKINVIPLANDFPTSPERFFGLRATVRKADDTISNTLIFKMSEETTVYVKIINVEE